MSIDMHAAFDFRQQRIVMSGGSGVLGASMVRGLVQHGATVVLLTRQAASTRQKFRDLPAPQLEYMEVDLNDATQLPDVVAQIARTGPITALINGAGGNRPTATTGQQAFADVPAAAMQEVINVNLMSAIQLSQQVLPHLLAHPQAAILNTSSISTQRPLTRVLAYSAAKAGLDAFTRWLATHVALEHAPSVRVNAIAPGFFLTEQNRYLLMEADGVSLTTRGQQILAHTPMARFGTPDDLVGTVLWLLSPAAAFVTGQVIAVDGGFSAFSGV
jgi:NAD(P)-dependent dehydrogenase (short-subunit alcohol dehydrogenase family)